MLKKIQLSYLILLISSSLLASETTIPAGKMTGSISHEMPAWFTDSFLDISEDVATAKANNKNILLFFHLNQCPYCDAMLNENFRGGKNTDFIKDKFSVIAVNIKGDNDIRLNEQISTTEKKLSQQLDIQYTPTIIFLNQANKTVYRTNGYRSPAAFRSVLNYVTDKAYKKQSLADYIEQKNPQHNYQFIAHSGLKKAYDFSNYKKPVALLFENKDCTDCEVLHQTLLNDAEITKALNEFLWVRIDSYSDQQIIGFDGKATTARELAKTLKINYYPSLVLFNQAKEITRIESKLYRFHFKEILRFVSADMYQQYPNFLAYLKVREAQLLKQGVNIDISR